MMTTSTQLSANARQIAEALLQPSEETRSPISLDVVESLRNMVDETKHQDPRRAMQIADCAVQAAAQLDDPVATAIAAWAKATAHIFLFELQSALENLRIAEEIFLAHNRLLELVSVQSPLVYVLNALGDYNAALALAEEVRPRCQTLDTQGLSSLINLEMNVGTVLIQRGEYAASLLACDRASHAASQLGDTAALGRIDINRANVFQELDRHADAERCYQRARVALLQSQQNRQQVALVDLNLGLLALRRGDYWQSLHHLDAAGQGFVSPAHIAWVDFNRALVYHRLNLNSETVELASRAVDALNATGSQREVAMALQVWASAAEKLGALAEADALLQRAYEHFQQCGATVMAAQAKLALAEFALRTGNSERAQSLLAELRQQRVVQQIPTLLAQIELAEIEQSLLHKSSFDVPLLAQLDQAIATLKEGGQALLLLRAQQLRGQLFAVAEDNPSAMVAYRQAMDGVLDMRNSLLLDEFQIAFLEQHLPLFLEIVALYLRSGESTADIAHTLALATTTPEQHRGNRATYDINTDLSRLRNDWHWQQSKLEKLIETTQSAQEIEAAQRHLRQIEAQIADVGRRLTARSQSAAQLDTLAQQIRHWPAEAYAAKLQASLGGQHAYLHFFVVNELVHLLIATAKELSVVALGAAAAVDSALRAWHHHLRDWTLIAAQPVLATQIANRSLTLLSRALIQPLLPWLQEVSHLYFMLPPQWSDLPLAALLLDGVSLIDRWTLTQLVSPLSLFAGAQPPLSNSPQSLLIGLSQAAGLTQTTHELQQISGSSSNSWTHQLLLDEAATQESVLSALGDCDLLHIATHAIFRADNPLFSWLQLADGRLTVADLYHRVQLARRPLTVLSACETARGQHSGLLGVARALLAAGAGELIATQWRVEDAASAQLMGEFYRHWFAQTARTATHSATALAAAQRTFTRTLHPAYWAGFVNIR